MNDTKLTIEEIKTAAEQGDCISQSYIGYCYLTGEEGVEENIHKAIKWLELSCSSNLDYGCYLLSMAYANIGHKENDEEMLTKSYNLCKKGMKNGYLPSILYLGKKYYHGIGVDKNEKVGLEYINLAADKGSVWAKRALFWIEYDNKKNIFSKMLLIIKFIPVVFRSIKLKLKSPDDVRLIM